MKKIYLIIALLVVVAAGLTFAWHERDKDPQKTVTKNTQQATEHTQKSTDTFDKTQYSTADPASIWVVVNKLHPLQPASYAPTDLALPNVSQRQPGEQTMKMRSEAATALEELFKGAQAAGYDLQITTAYRSYAYQATLYNNYVSSDGQAAADTYSARPGHSEHQTGLAVDIRPASGECYLEVCFGDRPEGKWLAAHAYEYGFIIRYPKDKTAVTGYQYEPWHVRYVGKTLAAELHKIGTETLEEFFELGAAPDYKK